MAPKIKYIEVAKLLRQRIEVGDYGFNTLPGAPRLAAEMGVSYLTARQAVSTLIEDGIVHRATNGRLKITVHPNSQQKKFKIAYIFLVHTPSYNVWRHAIMQAAARYECCTFREINCSHSADPLLFDALDGDFDLIFLQVNQINPLLMDKIRKKKERVVTLFHDLTADGVRCFDGPSPASIGLLMEHLHTLGHRRIDCFFHTERENMQRRIQVWRDSLRRLCCEGECWNSVEPEPFMTEVELAYRSALAAVDSGRFRATGLFCLTTSQAMGVVRAFYERGIRVPEDVSIVSFGELILSRMMIPSVTVVCPQQPQQTASQIIEHFLGIHAQPDKLMFRTPGEEIQYGESTAPAQLPPTVF